MKIIAVVVTYNRKKLLMECLEALLGQTYDLQEIVLFDNASTDGTKETVEDSGILDNGIVKYIRHETNSGGAGGFYYGSKQAYQDGADWIWMMDDDCIPTPTALEELMKAAKIVDASFLCSAVFSGKDTIYKKPPIDLSGVWYKYLHLGIVKVHRGSFVSFLLSRQAVNQCGLPYKEYFIWGDDDEYSYRLIKYFKAGYFVGKSQVIHKAGKENLPWNSEQSERIKLGHYRIRNSLLNAKEYHTFPAKIKLRYKFARLAVRIVFSKRKKKLLKLWQIILGFWEFHIGSYNRRAFKNRFNNI